MNYRLISLLVTCTLLFINCTTTKKTNADGELTFQEKQMMLTKKFGDAPPKGYQPINPIPILITPEITDANREGMNKQLLNCLPNETVRLVIGKQDGSGNITFGPFTATTSSGSYVVILDYIKYKCDFLHIILDEDIKRYIKIKIDSDIRNGILKEENSINAYSEMLTKYIEENPYWIRSYSLHYIDKNEVENSSRTAENESYNIPIYIGIGVRMTASVTVFDAKVDLGSLYGIATAAQYGKLQGTLIIQTLGLSGENISPQIPLPSEINVTTIQNAIQSIATIKSKIYDQKVNINPGIVAIDDNIGRYGSKEQIISGLNIKSDTFKLDIK